MFWCLCSEQTGQSQYVMCSFCDATVTGCSSTRVYADIVWINVVGQKKMNIKACIPKHRKDDNWNAQFKTAQQLLDKNMMTTESKPSSSKAKQSILDLTSPANRTLFGELKAVESKTPDFLIAIFIFENALLFDVAYLKSLAALVDQSIEFGQQHKGHKYKAMNQWSWWSVSRCSTWRHCCFSSPDYG